MCFFGLWTFPQSTHYFLDFGALWNKKKKKALFPFVLRALIAPQHAPLALAALLLLFPCFGHCNGQCKCLAHPDSSIHRPQRPLNIQKSAIFKGILGVCWHENFSLDETKKKTQNIFCTNLCIFSTQCRMSVSLCGASIHTTIYNCGENGRKSIRCYQSNSSLRIISWEHHKSIVCIGQLLLKEFNKWLGF